VAVEIEVRRTEHVASVDNSDKDAAASRELIGETLGHLNTTARSMYRSQERNSPIFNNYS
jgi:hypothetical protein